MLKFTAHQVYLIFAGTTALLFSSYATLSSVYRVDIANLSPLELILIGTVLELTVFLFEVPTGVVADVFSRRLSVIIGMMLIGAGFFLEGALPVFGFMLLAQVLWGLGATFESGAIDAWLSDEVGEAQAGPAFLRAAQVGQLSSFAGIGLSVWLGQRYLGLPMMVAGAGYMLLGVVLALIMPEQGFRRAVTGTRHPLIAMRETFSAGFMVAKRNRLIVIIFVITAVLGASSEVFDRLSVAHFLRDVGMPARFSPAVWFGLISAGVSVMSIIITEVMRRTVDTNAHVRVAKTLLAINVVLSLSVVGFALAGNFMLALCFYANTQLMRMINAPLYRAWLNQKLESRTRATVFSMNSQMDALGQVAGGPVFGVLAGLVGMPVVLVLAGVLLLPASWLYWRSFRSVR